MSLTARLGLNLHTNLFLEFVKNYHTLILDRRFLVQCLKIVDNTLGVAPLSLQDGQNFSPDLALAMQPLLDFLAELATTTEDEDLRELVVGVMVHLALARGSVAEVLALVDVFQRRISGGIDTSYKIGDFLGYLSEYEARQEGVISTKKYEGKVVSIQTTRGQFVSAAEDGNISLVADCKDREVFSIQLHGSQVAFVSNLGSYLRATDDNKLILSPRCGSAEKFTLVPTPENSDFPDFVAIRTRRNTFLQAHETEPRVVQEPAPKALTKKAQHTAK